MASMTLNLSSMSFMISLHFVSLAANVSTRSSIFSSSSRVADLTTASPARKVTVGGFGTAPKPPFLSYTLTITLSERSKSHCFHSESLDLTDLNGKPYSTLLDTDMISVTISLKVVLPFVFFITSSTLDRMSSK